MTDAAVQNNAFNPEQIVEFLRHKSKLTEVLDVDGKKTGSFAIRIKFDDYNEKNELVTLELTAQEAVKRMSETERFMNLFKDKGSGGIGGRNQNSGKPADLATIAKDLFVS